MRVQLDMPEADVRRIQAIAAARHTTPGDVVRSMVLGPAVLTVAERIKALALAGHTDAEISAVTGETPNRVAAVRNEWGIRPNRHRATSTGESWADGFAEYVRSFEVQHARRRDTFGGYLWGGEHVTPAFVLELAGRAA